MLKGIISGILSDETISIFELNRLSRWMECFDQYKTGFPFNRIYGLVQNVMEDGIITPEEQEQLYKVFNEFIDPIESISSDYDAEASIDLKGKTCCITGTCSSGTRDEVSEKLIEAGATIVNNVTKKTDILLVGGQGSTAWAYGNYGGKIKKALELRDKGVDIQIIGEQELFGGNT